MQQQWAELQLLHHQNFKQHEKVQRSGVHVIIQKNNVRQKGQQAAINQTINYKKIHKKVKHKQKISDNNKMSNLLPTIIASGQYSLFIPARAMICSSTASHRDQEIKTQDTADKTGKSEHIKDISLNKVHTAE